MRTIKAVTVIIILCGLTGVQWINARPLLVRPVPKTEPVVQKLSEERRSELHSALVNTRKKIIYLKSLHVEDKEMEKDYQTVSKRFDEMSTDYKGQDLHYDASSLLLQIEALGVDAENRITMAKRMHLLYMLMATFGLLIITAITFYYAFMYLRRRR